MSKRCNLLLAPVAALALAGCGAPDLSSNMAGDSNSALTGDATVQTVVMAADIAENGRTFYARDNAALIASHTPAVSALMLFGDNIRYESHAGTLKEAYDTFYKAPSQANFGQFDAISFPGTGNHEYNEKNAQGYYDYFASRMSAIVAMPSYDGQIDTVGKGYYSFDLNGWHFVSLNSNCKAVTGGCLQGSPQEAWLKDDLAAHATMPIVAFLHAPRYACGGGHGDATELQAFWADLVDAGADFVFNGHNHYYQRWQPLDKANPQAAVDLKNGLTEIVAGSYGVSSYSTCADGHDPRVVKQKGGDDSIGVFFLTIGSRGGYSFEYRLRSTGLVFDSGSGRSHHAAP
jgi:hypothetical protein